MSERVTTPGTVVAEARDATSLSVLDRALYALFARHADSPGHASDRHHYRGTDLRVSFDVYLARVYGLSWVALLAVAGLVGVCGVAVLGHATVVTAPPLPLGGSLALPGDAVVVAAAAAVGWGAKVGVVRLGGLDLRWRAAARRSDIERTLPSAVRYLHVLSSGSDGPRAMLRKVADTSAYGETAVSMRKAMNTAALTGSVSEGLGRVARDTPSRDVLAPFLLKFREHADQGEEELANYLRMESRMLGHRRARARQRAEGFLELLAEMFMVLLVLPSLLVIVLTVMSVIAPGLSSPVGTPVGSVTVRGLAVYASAAFVFVMGVGASVLVGDLRPSGQRVAYERPDGLLATLSSAGRNPASATLVAALPAGLVAVAAWNLGGRPVNVALAAYVAYAVPVGVVAVRRARVDDAKDREIKDFVHAVSGHVNLGRPFPEAVELVAREVDLGALNDDVADLAKNMRLTTHGDDGERGVRAAALDRFVASVGTPLAEQTVGLVTGALAGGSETGTVFDTLQTEIGRLYHEKRELRSNMLVYVAVGWTTALLVVGITVAVGMSVFEGFAQLSALSADANSVLETGAVDLSRARFRLYVVTQATMLATGWFAGTASRGRYEALLHSATLVAVCYAVFRAVGMI